jgi:hypothetical protein
LTKEEYFVKVQARTTLLMGTLCGVAGLLIGLWVSLTATGEGYELFAVYAFMAAFIVASSLWWLILARRRTYSLGRGAVAGALAGLLSHYVCWYLLILGSNVCYWVWGGCRSSLGEPPIDPLNALWAAAVFSAGSLLFFGWLTVPIGALIGSLVAVRQRTTST